MIRFPRMHIAESVANRILNLADDMRAGGFTPSPEPPTPPPELPPSPIMEGANLDAQLAQPPAADLAVPPELAEPGA